jgi:hypothetical protein
VFFSRCCATDHTSVATHPKLVLISRGRSGKAFRPHRNPLAWIVMTIAARGDRSSLSITCSSFLESANADRRDQAGQKDSTEPNHNSNQACGEAHRNEIPIPDG